MLESLLTSVATSSLPTSAPNPMMALLSSGMGFGMMIVMMIIIGFPLAKMAKEDGDEMSWMAFIPLSNLYTMVKLSGKEIWWIVLMLIPCVNIVAMIMVWWAIAEKKGKPGALAIGMLFPIVNLIVPYYLAFSD